MQSFIEDMFYKMMERITPDDQIFERECKEQVELEKTFSKEQKELFRLYSDACVARACEVEESIYRRGFNTGVLLMLEVLQSDLQL